MPQIARTFDKIGRTIDGCVRRTDQQEVAGASVEYQVGFDQAKVAGAAVQRECAGLRFHAAIHQHDALVQNPGSTQINQQAGRTGCSAAYDQPVGRSCTGKIGIKATLNKIPGSNWRTELNKKVLPIYTNVFSGWLDYPEYFFFWCYHGQNAVFNTMSYQNPKLDKMITNARFAESKPIYDSAVKEMIQLAYDEVPRIPLLQPTMDVAMQKDVQGYQYWFHLQPDYRQLYKQ